MLVFTAAFKSELPCEFIASCGYDIINLQSNSYNKNKGVLFFITGKGPDAAIKSALWIKKNINPRFVINLGTAGSPHIPQKKLISPQIVSSNNNPPIYIDTRIPFPIGNIEIIKNGTLLSIENEKHSLNTDAFDYIDMEAYYQAQVFSNTSFHILKIISDNADKKTSADFKANLAFCRKTFESLLNFLTYKSIKNIDVIIPVYNREKFITRAIDSVLNQSLIPKNIIVIDDGSTDNTASILKSYKNKIHAITLPINHGVSYARNIGASIGSSNWISFLDSDDKWTPFKLENQCKYINKYPYYEILQSNEIWFRNDIRVNQCKHHTKKAGWIWKDSLYRCTISPSSVLMKKQLFNTYKGFNESFPVCEDYDLWLKITRNHPVGLEPSNSLIKYGGNVDQLSKKYEAMDKFRIKALYSALINETDNNFKGELLTALEYKVNILIKGAQKRKNFDKILSYKNLLSSAKINF